ncbi:MAG: LysR family transcriptional regulator [Rhodobacteraceae bacterium]|nr:LysR family transcriptional regulator [Paracoccaceae bacterium]
MPSQQQFRYLVALADARHFRRAAEICNVAQPTLSAQIRALEARLGAPLVERGRGGVLLTPLGERAAERARTILAGVEEIRALARAEGRPFAGTMRLGAIRTLGPYLLPLVVPGLHRTHPELRLFVQEGPPDQMLERLEQGALDLALLPGPLRRAELEAPVLFGEPLMAVLPARHRLAAQSHVAPADLAGETVLTLSPGHRLQAQVRALLEGVGASLVAEYGGTSLDALRQMTAMEMGVTILPALYVRSEVTREELLVARPLAPPAPLRTVTLAWRRSAVRAEEFRALARLIAALLFRAAPELLRPDAISSAPLPDAPRA